MLAILPLAVMKAHSTRFIGDEIYTLRISQQPTLAQMVDLSREIDLHPPFHYFLQRAALATELPLWLASRLPSIVATAFTLALIFLFVSRHNGYLLGMFAAATFWFTPAIEFAWLNRPYALWLSLLALTAVLYQRATEFHRSPWLPLALFFSSAAMVLDYMAALACLLPFLVAEALRTRRRRQLDLALWLALSLPALSFILYLRPIAAFATNSFVPSYLNSFSVAGDMYVSMIKQPATILVACILAAVVLFDTSRRLSRVRLSLPRSDFHSRFAVSEEASQWNAGLTIGLCLLALPILLAAIAAMCRTQFFTRYGACAAIGFAFLAPWFLLRYVKYPRAVATFMTLAFVITAAVQCSRAGFEIQGTWRTFQPTGVRPIRLDRLDASLPIVVASPIGYTEMNAREPASLLSRTYYLYDRDSAIQFSGSTIFENEDKIASLMNLPGKTAPLAPFLATHSRFYMIASYTDPEEWLPRKLMASGAALQYLGNFESTYRDVDLYLVTPATPATNPSNRSLQSAKRPQ